MGPRTESVERSELAAIARAAGQRLTFARKAAGYKTQEDLAAALGVRQSTIYRWEIGERLPRLQHQIALVRLLKQSHEFLFGVVVTPEVRKVS